jgi:hypothetical protein
MMEAPALLDSSLGIDDCQFAGERFPGPAKRLSGDEVRKFLGGNFRRVFDRVWRKDA